MANVDFDMTVQQTVINVTDQTGETFEVTPQPKVDVSVAEGSGGGGSKNLEEWFGVSDEMQTLAATPSEIICECKDIFAVFFPDITMPNEVKVDDVVYIGEFPSI